MFAGSKRGAYAAVAQLCVAGGSQPDCSADRAIKIAIYLTVVVAILCFGATLSILLCKLRAFRELSYAQIQVAVVFYRLQVSCSEVGLVVRQH